MSEIINLNKARKARAKTQKSVSASQNRLLFGLPADMRKAEQKKRQAAETRHEGHRLSASGDGDESA